MTIDIDLNTVSVPFDVTKIFGAGGPVHVEIGSGKGRFLLKMAAERPEISFLAVERAAKYHRLVCEKAGRRGLENVRLLRTTAEDLLFRLLPSLSVDALYVLFPDPWPKKRHHKRRLFTPETTEAMVSCLKTGAPLLVKSDHPGYAEVIKEVLQQTRGLEVTDPEEAFSGLPLTGFESKYVIEGRQIHAFSLVKK